MIHVNPGTYLENTRCALSPGVSIEGEGATSIITNTSLTSRINYGPNGSNGDAIINLVSASVVNGNQEIRNLKFDGSSYASSHALYIMNRHNVKVHDCTFENFNYCAVAWWASGTGDGVAPSTRLTGSEFYNNSVTNCAGYNAGDGSFYGALYCGGHTGMLIHDNTMIENGHSIGTQGWPIKFWLWGGMMLGCKIYNNYLEKTDYSVWDFAIESTGEDGMEIYNNTIKGGVDLNKQNYSGAYPYSVYIHDNTIGATGTVNGMYNAGITLEHNNSHILIERNIIQNCSPAILFTPRNLAQTDVTIRYNLFKNIKTSGYYTEGITMNPGSSGTTINGFYVYNNVFHGTSGSTDYGIRLVHSGGAAISSATNVRIINNVFMNFNGYSGAPIYLTGASAFSGLNIQNNIFYNNGTNAPVFSGTPTNYTNSGNLTANPGFTSVPNDFTLLASSPAIDAGLDVGLSSDILSNFVGTSPDIGAYEYGSNSIPVYVSSSIENAAPSILAMTYSRTLDNIVPDASAFTVTVNSVARNVSLVTISGTKVLLTLESPAVYGDIINVAYTKPATNPLQTSAGEAESISARAVTNNILSPIPVYVSSVIENAAPAVLVMTYNMNLANIVPATTAFTVMVNSVSRAVNTVTVSGTQVRLTLASAVAAGNIVTVAYTKPATTPLQTSAGDQAASITARSVTNNVTASLPVYISSVVENATPTTLTMSYNQYLATNVIPATSAFTVMVNSTARTVLSLAINTNKVQLTLSSAIVYGDIVTVRYTKPATNQLQSTSGGQAATITAQTVTNNVIASSPAYVSSTIYNASPSILISSFNRYLSTSAIPSIASFTVLVNSTSRAISSISINTNKVNLTLSSPVVYGDVVTIAYTKPASNPLQGNDGGQVASFTSKPVTNNVGVANTPPVIAISYSDENISGFVGEIDASGTTDANSDILTFSWTAPAGVEISSATASKIRFLAPIVSATETITFGLSVSDGLATETENVSVTIVPYKHDILKAEVTGTNAITYIGTNYPENVADDDITTFWSANGDSQWLVCKLANPFRIDHFKLSFAKESMGMSKFDILASKDSLTWDPVITNANSCGFSDDLQVFTSQGSSINNTYSYITYIGYGNSLNAMNKVSEIQVFGATFNNEKDALEIRMIVYPNPASDMINITFETAPAGQQLIRLVGMSGQVHYEETYETGVNFMQIPVNFPPGFYVLQLISEGRIRGASKVIIQE